MLYKAAPRAPQLENRGIWKAEPILISGASAYRRGEFLYQDFLYDDTGANGTLPDATATARDPAASGSYSYPTHPDYASNAADLVEVRVKRHGQDTVFRLTLNTLLAPNKVGVTLALGDSASPREFPHGANVSAPAELFLTWHGYQAELIDAKQIDLPMLDRMYKEYPTGEAPEAMETLAGKIREADGFVFVTGGAYTEESRRFLDQTQAPVLHKPFKLADLRAMVAEMTELVG